MFAASKIIVDFKPTTTMVKANEIRIGNYILGGSGLLVKVVGLDKNPFCRSQMQAIAEHGGEYTLDYCTPIPLTEEWLLKFGFSVSEKQGSQGVFRVYTQEPLTFNSNHGWWLFSRPIDGVDYVHQLQNLYYALTGTELEIVGDEGRMLVRNTLEAAGRKC